MSVSNDIDIRERAKELLKLTNSIDDKYKQIEALEKEIEKLQVYRNERGEQLLTKILDIGGKKDEAEEKV